MRDALEAVPGVRVLRISFREQLAVVRYDEDAARIEDMAAALRAAGYKGGWDVATEKRTEGGSR